MISRKSTFFLGIFIFLIPFLGLPSSWKTTLIILSGIGLITMSVKITLPKKNVGQRSRKKEKVTPVFVETAPVYKSDDVVEVTKPKSDSNPDSKSESLIE